MLCSLFRLSPVFRRRAVGNAFHPLFSASWNRRKESSIYTMGKKASKRAGSKSENNGDWISAMAKQAVTQESAALPSKAERKERRNAKKRRRQERKPMPFNLSLSNTRNDEEYERECKRMNRMSVAYLRSLARTLEHRVMSLQESSSCIRPYQSDAVKKGKATAGNRLNDEMVQPRLRDYGGLGLARPSMYISLHDPSFVPKLEEEFAEHIPGFFGKQKTKARKKQLDGNMLWRQLAEKREGDRKFGGKKLSEMNPDERVEAMIKAGMI